MPPETLAAYRDHGDPKVRIHDDLPRAHSVFSSLVQLKIDEKRISLELEEEGARKFVESYEKVMKALHDKHASIRTAR